MGVVFWSIYNIAWGVGGDRVRGGNPIPPPPPGKILMDLYPTTPPPDKKIPPPKAAKIF